MLFSYCILIFFTSSVIQAGVFNRYYPNPRIGSENGVELHKIYVDKSNFKKVECVASFGLTPEMKATAEKSILDHFTGIIMNSGLEAHQITVDMENTYGGFWMVGIFSADFDVAYTITRRSRHYGVFTIDDRMILIAEDGNTGFHG